MINIKRVIFEEQRRVAQQPFKWGTADCLVWAAAVAIRIIERDPIAHLRGQYNSEFGARRVMAAYGWKTLDDVAGAIWMPIPIALAQIGDWATYVNVDGSDVIGVVAGEKIAARAEIGTTTAPLLNARAAFRVLQ